jgi:hypothetical protein
MNKIAKAEAEIKELRKQRDLVKENHEPSLRQVFIINKKFSSKILFYKMNMFNDLKKLLTLKLSVTKNDLVSKRFDQKGKEESSGNVNRLVIRD